MENGDGLFRETCRPRLGRTFYSLARGHVLKRKDKTTTYKLLL